MKFLSDIIFLLLGIKHLENIFCFTYFWFGQHAYFFDIPIYTHEEVLNYALGKYF